MVHYRLYHKYSHQYYALPLTVIAKGGTLQVTHAKDDHVYLEGPAVEAFVGTVEVPDDIK